MKDPFAMLLGRESFVCWSYRGHVAPLRECPLVTGSGSWIGWPGSRSLLGNPSWKPQKIFWACQLQGVGRDELSVQGKLDFAQIIFLSVQNKQAIFLGGWRTRTESSLSTHQHKILGTWWNWHCRRKNLPSQSRYSPQAILPLCWP